MEKYEDLSFLLKVVLTLSHGQAAVERSFSLGNALLNYNMSEDSLKTKNVIKDHMLSNGLEPPSYYSHFKSVNSICGYG